MVRKMLTKRIIPCLDVKEGRVVKGINFKNFEDVGDPVKLAVKYSNDGADEISFLDITASYEKRKILLDTVKKVAREIFIPLSVGGGISSLKDIQKILNAGAEKVSIGTAAVLNPPLIKRAAKKFGSQSIVLSIDAKMKGKNSWTVFIKGGRKDTKIDAIEFAKEMEEEGAGEILLNSIDKDGTKSGFDIQLTKKMTQVLNIPVIASGGAGNLEDIKNIIMKGKADAVLAASIFHYKKYSINEVKNYLKKNGIEVRV